MVGFSGPAPHGEAATPLTHHTDPRQVFGDGERSSLSLGD